jgi:hypothetical protein
MISTDPRLPPGRPRGSVELRRHPVFFPRGPIILTLTALFVPLSTAVAQPKKEDPYNYRRFLTPPKITPEFWEAMLFELEVGRMDLAAGHLHSLVTGKPTLEELAQLHQKEGISAFLRLRLIPRWFEDREKEKQAREDVEALIEKVTEAVRTRLSDPARIKKFVENLYGLPEEVAFARIELARSGAVAIPFMLEELSRKREADRLPILDAMTGMGHDAMRPRKSARHAETPPRPLPAEIKGSRGRPARLGAGGPQPVRRGPAQGQRSPRGRV